MDNNTENIAPSGGTLYICATPIGNLGDITLRVIDTLKSVDLIAAEDTRNSLKLLNHFDIKVPLISYHEFNRFERAEELIEKLKAGKNIALITDAGTPVISDPGEVLIARCYDEGISVTSLPGPSAVITALTLCGFSVRGFAFEGFIPPRAKKKEREEALERIREESRVIVLYEAPHHLNETLKLLIQQLGGDRHIALCRELTKKHEEVIRGKLSELMDTEPKGEYVIVIEAKDRGEIESEKKKEFEDLSIEEHVDKYIATGLTKKEAMRIVAKERGLAKRDIYNALIK